VNRIYAIALLSVATLVVVVAFSFKREYVLPATGLLELSAAENSGVVVVSGAIRSSGAKITRITTTRFDDYVLVRVYADAIRSSDDPKDCAGTFIIPVALSPEMSAIKVGESPRSVTVGQVFGVPIRVPRFRRHPSAVRVVWSAR
jgi:hypothetical protein